jgi:flagellar biosynthesis regulator FlbT
MLSIKIELRINFRSDTEATKKPALLSAAQMAAKHLYTTGLLLQDDREPTIALYTDDMFVGEQEIMLADDIDTSAYGA